MPTISGSGKWKQENIGNDCFVKKYEKGTMFRMPAGSDYTGYVFFHPNSLIKQSRRLVDLQSDGWELCTALLFSEDFTFELQQKLPNGEVKKVSLTTEQFSEQIRKAAEMPLYQDDKAYLENCPSVLRSEKKFIIEKLTWDKVKGKFAKLPINPNTEKLTAAEVDNPDTWGTFEQTCAALEKLKSHGLHGGIGYVLTSDTNIVGIDLDLDKNTHELTPQGKEILSMLKGKTYIEYSASGAVHILGFGSKPGNFCKGKTDSDIEMYGSTAGNRALMLTGKVHEGVAVPMANIQTQIDEIYKKYFYRPEVTRAPEMQRSRELSLDEMTVLSKLRAAKNSQKFERLMAGDLSGYGDYNIADLALCSMIAYYTDDEKIIDSIYRQSGLYSAVKTNVVTGRLENRAEKWDSKRRNGTYGEQTIAKAIAGLSGRYEMKDKQPVQPMRVKKQTEKAVLVLVATPEAPSIRTPQWLPKSGIELRQNENGTCSVVAATGTLIADHNLPRPVIKPVNRR